MVEERNYCSHVMKKYFYKELVMTKEDDADFENSTKCWICDNVLANVKFIIILLENIGVLYMEVLIFTAQKISFSIKF